MSDRKKNCPFCGEEILAIAVKCKHCKSDLKAADESEDADADIEILIEKVSGFRNIGIGVFAFAFLLIAWGAIDSSLDESRREEAQQELANRNAEELRRNAEEIRNSATQSDAQAKLNAGVRFLNGDGVTIDEVEALSWFRMAADEGNADAETYIGYLYDTGRAGLTEDDEQAIEWYRSAANRGSVAAQYNLGIKYAGGNGVAQDPAVANNWFQRAADQGYQLAQDRLTEYDDQYGLEASRSELIVNHDLGGSELDEFITTYGSFRAVYDVAEEATENDLLLKGYLELLAYEEGCKNDWSVCKNNSDLVNINNEKRIYLTSACLRAAKEQAEELRMEVDWGGFFTTNFGMFSTGTSAKEDGLITFEDREAKADNAFGGQTPITTTCIINVDTQEVAVIDINV